MIDDDDDDDEDDDDDDDDNDDIDSPAFSRCYKSVSPSMTCADHVLGRSQHGQFRAAQCQITERRDNHWRRNISVKRHRKYRQKPQL